MEATTTTTATTGWATQSLGEKIFSVTIFGVATGVTIAFAYYLFTDPTRLTELWEWTRSLPILVQLVVWLLFLPWMIALWLFSLPMALAVRIVLVVALLAFTEYLVYPIK